MQTTIQNKKKGMVKFVSQQYPDSLYVAIYYEGKSMPDQMGCDVAEKEFHMDVRKNLKRSWKVIAEQSTNLEGERKHG